MGSKTTTLEDFKVKLIDAEAGLPNAVTVRDLRNALLAMADDAIGIGATAAKTAEMAAAYLTQFGDPGMALEVDTSVMASGRSLNGMHGHKGDRKNVDFGGWPIDSKNCRNNCGFEAAPLQKGFCFQCAGITSY